MAEVENISEDIFPPFTTREMGAARFPFFIQPLLCDRMLIPFSMPSNSAFLRRGNLIVSDGGGNVRLPFHTW